MTNQEIIAQLRAHGYRVRVQHLRHLTLEPLTERAHPMRAIREMRLGRYVEPRGGLTLVDLYLPGMTPGIAEDTRHGIAACSLLDTFCSRVGLRIALNHAVAPSVKDWGVDTEIEEIQFSASGKIAGATIASGD